MKWLIPTHKKRLMSYLDQYVVKLYAAELFLGTRGWINTYSRCMHIYMLNFLHKPLYYNIGLSKWSAKEYEMTEVNVAGTVFWLCCACPYFTI